MAKLYAKSGSKIYANIAGIIEFTATLCLESGSICNNHLLWT